MNINHFTLSGRITQKPVLRHTPNGLATVTYSVAVNQVSYDNEGKKVERVDFIPVTRFGKSAENDAKYLDKGDAVIVEGQIRSWYVAETKKGGFNFIASNVEYPSRSTKGDSVPTAPETEAHEEWVNDYNDAQE
jgi:single-strand DNA-binding protein